MVSCCNLEKTKVFLLFQPLKLYVPLPVRVPTLRRQSSSGHHPRKGWRTGTAFCVERWDHGGQKTSQVGLYNCKFFRRSGPQLFLELILMNARQANGKNLYDLPYLCT